VVSKTRVRPLLKPRALPPGGTLAVVAPAGPVDLAQLEKGAECWRSAGFRVRWCDDIAAHCGYLAGSDERRAREFIECVRNPEIDAVVCARGGYGSQRLFSLLDAEVVRRAAKPLVGFSDATALLLWQMRCAGLIGFHGPMLQRQAPLAQEEFGWLCELLTGAGDAERRLCGRPGGGGCVAGPLVGGSLSLVLASLGTPWEIETEGAILLLEEVNEPPYRIDRMLHQLWVAGKLAVVAGVGLGTFEACVDPRRAEPTAETVAEDILRRAGVAWVSGLPFGHGVPNFAWPVGGQARLDADAGELWISERAVKRD